MDGKDIAKLCIEVEDRVQSRCLGLLECVVEEDRSVSGERVNDDNMFLDGLMYYAKFQPQPRRIQFMHRTVKSFDKPGTWDELRSPPHDDEPLYDAHQALSFSSLVQLKNTFSSRNWFLGLRIPSVCRPGRRVHGPCCRGREKHQRGPDSCHRRT